MDSHDLLISALSRLPSEEWTNRYFDLLKKILTDLELDNDDPRIGLSLTKSKDLPVNIGQRYLLKPYTNKYLGILVPADFEESAASAETIFFFKTNKKVDSKFIRLILDEKTVLHSFIYDACIEACTTILQKTTKTGYRKYHDPLVYHFTMEHSVRNEILSELYG